MRSSIPPSEQPHRPCDVRHHIRYYIRVRYADGCRHCCGFVTEIEDFIERKMDDIVTNWALKEGPTLLLNEE